MAGRLQPIFLLGYASRGSMFFPLFLEGRTGVVAVSKSANRGSIDLHRCRQSMGRSLLSLIISVRVSWRSGGCLGDGGCPYSVSAVGAGAVVREVLTVDAAAALPIHPVALSLALVSAHV